MMWIREIILITLAEACLAVINPARKAQPATSARWSAGLLN